MLPKDTAWELVKMHLQGAFSGNLQQQVSKLHNSLQHELIEIQKLTHDDIMRELGESLS